MVFVLGIVLSRVLAFRCLLGFRKGIELLQRFDLLDTTARKTNGEMAR